MLSRLLSFALKKGDQTQHAVQGMVRAFATQTPTPSQGKATAKTPSETAATVPVAAAPKLPDPPTSIPGVPGAVATLLWQCAAKEKALDKVQSDIHTVLHAFTLDANFGRLATDPFIAPAVRKAAIQAAVNNAPELHPLSKNLVVGLAEENSLAPLVHIASAYDELMLAHKKEVHCTIVTAAPMDKMEREVRTKEAEKFVEPGFKLVMEEKVDKKLLGGFVLEFEDRRVDMSEAKKLEEFNNLVTKLENDLK